MKVLRKLWKRENKEGDNRQDCGNEDAAAQNLQNERREEAIKRRIDALSSIADVIEQRQH